MSVNYTDFDKIWASTSPLTPYEFSEAQYKEGWNFVGATPPSRQMWDFLQKQTDEKIQYIYNNMIPVGIVQAFAGSTTPQGWLLCDGSAVSRTDYADLFAVIGETYGSGDGSTTFNVPNLIDRFVQGNATAGTVKSAGLPNIASVLGYIKSDQAIAGTNAQETNTALRWGNIFTANSHNLAEANIAGRESYFNIDFDASRSNAIYGNSTTVQPPALTMRYIIKY